MPYDIFERMFSADQRKPDYENCLKQMDDFINKMQLMYLGENHSPSSALISLGFRENQNDEHRYEYDFGDGFIGIVNFYDFDMNDGMIEYYVLDENGKIPVGYCSTKYELQENEVYDDVSEDMVAPDFMEKAFDRVYGQMEDSESLNEDYANLPQWLANALDNPYMAGKVVKRELSDKGVDLANATYIKASIPRSNRDPVLKDSSRLPVYRLDDHGRKVVYIRGYNNPFISSYGSYGKYCDEMPIKAILDITTEYGYIDLNDARNTNVQKRLDRRELAKSVPDDVKRGKGQYLVHRRKFNYETGKYDIEQFEWVMTKGQDKSGYPIDPDKYIKKLDSVGFDNYGDRLESYYNKVESLRSRLIPLITKFSINDPNPDGYVGDSFNNSVFADLSRAVEYFSDAVSSFQTLKQSIDGAIEFNAEDTDIGAKELMRAFRYDATSVRENVKSCEKLLSKLEAVDVSSKN